jgi:DNA polymerase III subunit epsilon
MEHQFAVIDVETTGLNPYRNDRVIEIAVVLWVPDRGITADISTLVNPERDIGPMSIHGISASDIINAPRFMEITDQLNEFWRNAVALVGHNVRFDISFLRSEYGRIGVEMPQYTMIDTMALAGGGCLSACCAEHGIEFEGKKHSALHDARATAHLLERVFRKSPDLLGHYDMGVTPTWPIFQTSRGHLLSRDSVGSNPMTSPRYLQKLAECLSVGSSDMTEPVGERDYQCFLWRVLEDGRLEESEEKTLMDVAINWGLSLDRVKAIHLEYLGRLAKAALADNCITDAERREISNVAQLLGFGILSDEEIQKISSSHEKITYLTTDEPCDDWAGKTVCFTGECGCCINGQLISREVAEKIAASKGLQVMPSVTKKLDILVVSDPNTQSGKAKKARQYGIRIVHEPFFWRSLCVPID